MKVSDELMIRYYELLSDKTVNEMNELKEALSSGKVHPRKAKVDLAKFLVTRFYNSDKAEQAEEEFNRIFKDKGTPDDMPEYTVDFSEPVWICHLMVETNLTKSSSEARRLVQERPQAILDDLDPGLVSQPEVIPEKAARKGLFARLFG